MSKDLKIRVEGIEFKTSKFPIEYRSTRIKRDANGEVVLTHGRPESEEIMEVRIQRVHKPYLLIEGNWYRDKEAWKLFGRKKVIKAVKAYVEAASNREYLERKLGM